MLIINCGYKKGCVCKRKYHAGEESEEFFRQAGISLEYFSTDVESYTNQEGGKTVRTVLSAAFPGPYRADSRLLYCRLPVQAGLLPIQPAAGQYSSVLP